MGHPLRTAVWADGWGQRVFDAGMVVTAIGVMITALVFGAVAGMVLAAHAFTCSG